MLNLWSRPSTGWKTWLALIVLIGFALQSILRLALLTSQMDVIGRSAVGLHALSLFAFATFFGLLLILVRGRPIGQLVATLTLATVGCFFSLFDSVALVTLPVTGAVMPLEVIFDSYCSNKSIAACLGQYQLQTLPILGLIIGWTAIIYICADELAQIIQSAWNRTARFVPAKGLKICLLTIIFSYVLCWAIFPAFLSVREPVYAFLVGNQSPMGPAGLLWGERKDYRPEPSPHARPRPVILITVDSLRADSVELEPDQPSQTPFLQSLASSGSLHSLGPAIASCPYSYCGIAALQTGNSWAGLKKGPPMALADVLAANGYRSYFLLSGRHRTYRNLAELYGSKVDILFDDSSPDSHNIADDREQVARLSQLKFANPSQSYLSIHLMSVHAAGFRFGSNREAPSLASHLIRSLSENSGSYRDRYQQGVRQMDGIIRDLFEELDRKELLDDALVIITADHGERIEAHRPSGHGPPIDPATTAIPLLIYDARQNDWPEQTIASQIDVAPTILAAVNITQPPSFPGAPLQSLLARRASPVDSKESAGIASLVNGMPTLFRCDLDTGIVDVLPFNGAHLSTQDGAQRPSRLSKLYRSNFLREEAKRCFR